MNNLILTIISIALMAWVTIESISYINPVAVIASKLSPQLLNGFHSLESGYNNYTLNIGSQPNLMTDIAPHYAFVPAAPNGTSWSFGSGGASGTGRYFCLSGSFNAAILRASINLQQNLSPQAYFINSTCGATSTLIPTGSNPTVALTYWVAAYQ